MHFDEKRAHIRELANGGRIKALILSLVCSVEYPHTYTYVIYSEINKGNNTGEGVENYFVLMSSYL